jgi:hypothetical protein
MPSVFIPHVPTHYDIVSDSFVPRIDIGPARVYGAIVPIITEKMPMYAALGKIRAAAQLIGRDDYILATGEVIFLSLAIAIALINNGSANILRWDKTRQTYTKEVVEL